MAKITKEELLKIAQLSHMTVHDDELDAVVAGLDSVLTYAARVTEIAADIKEESQKNVNVFREDVVKATDPAPLLAAAPERMHDYFVVPVIIESNQ
jgi:aspartyl/glutamyl-tRNA(Asn/Gln) amidotransferase C subunit